jgi:tRNA (guanine-N7-)-methyltransferase
MLGDSVLQQPLNFEAIFGNDRPVEVEIGSGKGTFLVARAQARPELNFLGIEYAGAYCRYAADRLRRRGLTNVRMLCADAGKFFGSCLQPASVWRVHVYFPDPWPKRRHHRRRLIQRPFVARAREVLRIGGQLIVVTDHMGYFEHIRRVLENAEGLAGVPMPKMAEAEGELVGTNFERKYIAQGRPFYAMARLRYR